MKNLFFFLSIFVSASVYAQTTPLRNGTQAMTYRIRGESGTNACGVTYNPSTQTYYTVFAGNRDYPLEAFDARGNNSYTGNVGIDVRSFWYNAKTKSLEGYAYPKLGKYSILLSKSGMPTSLKEPKEVSAENGIPNDQSVACLVNKKQLYYFDGTHVYVLAASNLKEKKKFRLSSIPGDVGNLNYTSMIYTGVKGYELGFYDAFEGKIYYTDLKGNYTGTTVLPSSAPKASAFRFAFANNLAWVYDVDNRTWYAYSVFN